ncbi:MAG: hypothetical protein LBC25_00285 [Holosporales bacterium]|jgi:hypothetical protein|nr:hypothetical protein [Holosporales bacterium]
MKRIVVVVFVLSNVLAVAGGPQPRGAEISNHLRSLEIHVHDADDAICATVKEQRFVSSTSQHIEGEFGIGDSVVVSVATELSRAPGLPGKSRTLRIRKFSVDPPEAEAFLHGDGRASLLLGDEGGLFKFPKTTLDFTGGVIIYRSGDETIFSSLKSPVGKVVPLSSAFSFIVNSISYPGGAYLITGEGIVPNVPSQIVDLGKKLETPAEPTFEGLRLEGILAGNYDRRDGFDSDFEKWLDRFVTPDRIGTREVARKPVLIAAIGKVVDFVIPRGTGDPECTLRSRFMKRASDYILQYPTSTSIPAESVPIDAAIKVMLDLRKVYTQIQDAPQSMREFLGDCFCDEDFTLRSNSVYSFTPGADRVLPMDIDTLRKQHCLALMQEFTPLVQAVGTSVGNPRTVQQAWQAVTPIKAALSALQAEIDRRVQEFSTVKAIEFH